ncbi:hemerythrin domain-containing protein [Diaminobutyricibacter sp. McL0618]|uniref:hemerythrin domain-containing protein n=1 Tax=Leifsonia sp. McL0618 TaxID=3415677 RepID=UPI003CE9D529
MVTQLPSDGMPPTHADVGCDTSGMLVIHRALRRVFTDAPKLVRDVPPGDTKRSTIIANHVAEFADVLHNHHVTEDESLWDTLEERSPACALHVGQMKAQHAQVAALLSELGMQLPAWKASADPAAGERVAVILDQVHSSLSTHLGQEENQILPVAAATMSQREWDAFGERGLASVPKNRMMVQLGYILDPFTPEERHAWMKTTLPGFARVLYRTVGRRQYETNYRRVYGQQPS